MSMNFSLLSLLWTRLVKGGSETLLVTSSFPWPSNAPCSLWSGRIRDLTGTSCPIIFWCVSRIGSSSPLDKSSDSSSGHQSNELIVSCLPQWTRQRHWTSTNDMVTTWNEKIRGLNFYKDRKYRSECTTQHETRIWWSKRVAYIKDADASLKNFLSHELQRRVLYARPTFKASRRRVHHARVDGKLGTQKSTNSCFIK